ncbi:hypothetical protein [Roseococcus pinisoli]|uniref:Uncharacterized protein n=1 Tax=Roseococcus pinisoli TaxID=2835040 RepID=A0ABS5QFH5_9PROT|nr:hypothetical protein [Roseococcus pinisoli]MBS7812297.1 hypothetical protein [Roseococcus pinisoli]
MPPAKIPTREEEINLAARDLSMRIGLSMMDQLRRTGQSFGSMAVTLQVPEIEVRVAMLGLLEGSMGQHMTLQGLAELCVAADLVIDLGAMSTEEFAERDGSYERFTDGGDAEDPEEGVLEDHVGTQH